MQPKGISGRSVRCQTSTISWPFGTILRFGELVVNLNAFVRSHLYVFIQSASNSSHCMNLFEISENSYVFS